MFRRGFYHREHMEALAQGLGCEPDIAFESNLIPLLKAVVKQGFAVTTFLRMALDEEPALTGIPFAPDLSRSVRGVAAGIRSPWRTAPYGIFAGAGTALNGQEGRAIRQKFVSISSSRL